MSSGIDYRIEREFNGDQAKPFVAFITSNGKDTWRFGPYISYEQAEQRVLLWLHRNLPEWRTAPDDGEMQDVSRQRIRRGTRETRSKRDTKPLPQGERTDTELVILSSRETEMEFYIKLQEQTKGPIGNDLPRAEQSWTAEIVLGVSAPRGMMTRDECRDHAMAKLQEFARQFAGAMVGSKDDDGD